MKIALFDEINEVHVCHALQAALASLGHEVLATGRLTTGFGAVAAKDVVARVDAAIDRVIGQGCSALLNFRAGALDATRVQRLRAAGVKTAVWLPDDPVLYATTYRDVVEAYDVVLHCGTERILAFYDRKGHRPGVNFPFWVDTGRWAWTWRAESVCKDLVFMGNLHGPAKQGRYARLSGAKGAVTVYGRCAADPAGIHAGELHGVEAMRAMMPLYAAGLNMVQRFADYAGTAYDFAGLAELGSFDLPSRVIQYAAVGLPVVWLGPDGASEHFPHALHADDIETAVRLARGLRGDPEGAMALSSAARQDVEAHFTAASRAGYLVALFDGGVDPANLDLRARAFGYRSFSRSVP